MLEVGQAGFGNNVILEVEHPLEITQRVVEQHADPAEGSDFRNQIWATGEANSIWPIRSRRTDFEA